MLEDIPSTEVADESATESDTPDGGYGWVNVVCLLLLTAHTWGVNGVG